MASRKSAARVITLPANAAADLPATDRWPFVAFHGVFAPNAKLRSRVVHKPPAPAVEQGAPPEKPRVRPSPSPFRLDWAAALKRVFGIDVLQCARCGGRLVILAFIEKRSAVHAILEHLGLSALPLPLEKARALHGRPWVASVARALGCGGPPQVAWDF
ncbi:MAG: hypothetical protein IT383_00315 [Deltaproteobacteria bacterium]|nr:hypothetical protein [Deltaproteobacteria bacterium]